MARRPAGGACRDKRPASSGFCTHIHRRAAVRAAGGKPEERLFVVLPGDVSAGPESGTAPCHMTPLAVPCGLRGSIGQALHYRETLRQGSVPERVLPDGALRLAIDFTSSGPASCVVLGPRTRPQIVQLRGQMEGVSLTLTPAAARVFLGVPVGDVADLDVPLAEFWGPAALNLAEGLREGGGDCDSMGVLWDALRRRLAAGQDRAAPAGLSTALAQASLRRDLVQAFGTGERRLQQVFREHVGLPPRTVLRLARWHGLLRTLRATARPDWAALAMDHGWFDQAHMNRDFRDFAGMSPTAYFAQSISLSSKTTG